MDDFLIMLGFATVLSVISAATCYVLTDIKQIAKQITINQDAIMTKLIEIKYR